MLNRREFAKRLALLAAGAAALPSQIAAFEQLYEANLPNATGLISIEDLSFCCLGPPRDEVVRCAFYDANRLLYFVPINRRASFRWVAAPKDPMLSSLTAFRWQAETEHLEHYNGDVTRVIAEVEDFSLTVRYVDQHMRQHTRQFTGGAGRLTT